MAYLHAFADHTQCVPANQFNSLPQLKVGTAAKRVLSTTFSICVGSKAWNWIIRELTQNSKYSSQIKKEMWLVGFLSVRSVLAAVSHSPFRHCKKSCHTSVNRTLLIIVIIWRRMHVSRKRLLTNAATQVSHPSCRDFSTRILCAWGNTVPFVYYLTSCFDKEKYLH
jgi:hypothetical protein